MTDLNVSLLPWQEEVYNDPARFKVIAAGRRTGKTQLAAWTLILAALQATKGKVFYVAPTQQQARDVIWHTILDLGKDVISSAHVNNLEIKLINGISINLKGGDRPETMRGVSLNYVVLDEYADVKPEVWELILRPALADLKGKAMFIGTPMGRNHFYDLYRAAEMGALEDYKSWHFTSYDNPYLDVDEVESAKRTMSSFSFRQEFMASFEAQGSEIFKEEWIKYQKKEPEAGVYYIACDLAGFAEMGKKGKQNKRLDNSSISIVKVNEHGWWVKEIIVGRWTLDETARKIFEAVAKYQPVSVGIERGISKQAVMSPLTDLMRRYNKYFRVEELTHGNQKKQDRIVWALQGRFENGQILLNRGDWNMQFLDELFQFPNHLVHDDTIDSLAYIDQLAQVAYFGNYEDDDYDIIIDNYAGY
jgi:predicted phage terminase large subunit-like protein